MPDGAEVTVTMPRRGLRSYLAVRGGFAVPPVLGSRSTDRLTGIGPPRPAADDVLPIGTAPPGGRGTGTASARGATPPAGEPWEVDIGPRDDWFTAVALETLLSAEFTVSPASDSVGLRLTGPALSRSRTAELPSEGVVRGAIQVPPDGQPIIFQSDHPVTGGYPVIAVLTPAAADLAAQARPGAKVRFAVAPRLIDRPGHGPLTLSSRADRPTRSRARSPRSSRRTAGRRGRGAEQVAQAEAVLDEGVRLRSPRRALPVGARRAHQDRRGHAGAPGAGDVALPAVADEPALLGRYPQPPGGPPDHLRVRLADAEPRRCRSAPRTARRPRRRPGSPGAPRRTACC
nr:hypothetical protein GCM10020092_020880 [Actinoplanes digitatis]